MSLIDKIYDCSFRKDPSVCGVVRVVVLLLAGDPQHDRGHQVFYGQEQQLAVQCPTTFGRAFLAVFSHVLLALVFFNSHKVS